MVRHHELKKGEMVFDDNNRVWGELIGMANDDETAAILTTRCKELNEELGHDVYAVPDIIFTDFDNVYQIADGLTDRDGNIICHEHHYEIDYPYYSPYLAENLYESETFKYEPNK